MNREYYYSENGRDKKGPLSIEQLESIGLKPNALIWAEGFDDWVEAREVAELRFLLGSPKVSPKDVSSTLLMIYIIFMFVSTIIPRTSDTSPILLYISGIFGIISRIGIIIIPLAIRNKTQKIIGIIIASIVTIYWLFLLVTNHINCQLV